jgi:hypothetical protein
VGTDHLDHRLERLLDLVSDDRARLLRRNLGHEQPMRDSINAAITELLGHPPVDLVVLLRLLVIEAECRLRSSQTSMRALIALALTGRPSLALELAHAIADADWQAHVLAALAKVWAVSDPDRAVETARAITKDESRADALAAVAAQPGHGNLVDEALEAALALPDDYHRADALAALVQAIAPSDPDRALEIAHGIGLNGRRAKALAAVAAQPGHGNLVDEALEAALALPDDYHRADALAALVQAMAPSDPDRALEIARGIRFYGRRAESLAAVATVPGHAHIAQEALEAARAIDEKGSRMKVEATVAETIAPTDPDRALRIAETITDNTFRARVLAAVAQSGRPDFADEARAMADAITGHDLQSGTLVKMERPAPFRT